METKLFEVRDSGTFLSVICIKLLPTNDAERFLLSRAGFGKEEAQQGLFMLYSSLQDDKIHYDPVDWGNRTRLISHQYIQEHWDSLNSGDVIDVQFILGETIQKKVSEALR